ncbi:MAG: ice-binding family protein [Gallionella sp.]|nr:ice-binding family protein [Gallionella sp.]
MNRFDSSTKPLVWFSALLLTAVVAGCGGNDPILGAGAGGTVSAGPAGITAANILKTAAPFGIAATAGVTNTNTAPITIINGDVVLDPVSGATCNAVAVDNAGGFGLCGSAILPSAFAPILGGTSKVYSGLYDPLAAVSGVVADLKSAFLQITPPAGPPAAGSLGGATNLPAGTTLGAVTGSALVLNDNLFYPGVYQSLTSIMVTGDLTLDAQGNPDAVFVFQSSSSVGTAAGGPTPASRTRILLVNGAKASNVWWQAATSATLGLYSEFQGNILASADITMETGATSCGRLLAGAFTSGAFVFDSNVVSVPGQPFAPPAGYSTTCQ